MIFLCKIRINCINKCFLGFRDVQLDWSERKLTATLLCHGGIKAWEITVKQFLLGFLVFIELYWRGYLDERKLDEGIGRCLI